MLSQSFLAMRNRNALAILRAVRSKEGLSRADVARACDLARSTVSILVDELIQNGVLLETGSITSNRGRRPVGLAFNPSSRLIIGISIDGKHAEIVLCDVEGALLGAHVLKLDCEDVESSATLLVKEVESKRKELKLHRIKVGAIGLAIPGPVSIVLEPTAGAEASKYQVIRKRLASKFDCNTVVDSNTNMAALAEIRLGIARPNRQTLVVRLGHEVRSAVIVNQKLLRGADGRAGEFGHCVAPAIKKVCDCGRIGCINAVASEVSILQACLDESVAVADIEAVLALASDGNSFCKKALENAGFAVGYGIATCINMFAPDDVTVTGRLVASGELLIGPLRAAVAKYSSASNLALCDLTFSKPDKHVEALGASFAAALDDDFLLELVADETRQILVANVSR